MTRKTARATGLAALLLCAGLGRAAESRDFRTWSLPVPGDVRAIEAACDELRCPLFVLVENKLPPGTRSSATGADREDAERLWSLHLWRPESPETLEELFNPLPERMVGRLESVDHGAGPQLALTAERRIWLLPVETLTARGGHDLGRATFEDPHDARRELRIDARAPRVLAYGTGHLDVFDLAGTSPPATWRLPVDVRRRPAGLWLASPPVRLLGPGTLAVGGPWSHADLRLQSLMIDLAQPPADSQEGPRESWSMLPAPESIEDSRYLWLDGRPHLLVVTLRADRQGFFEKKKLRIFELGHDRSRSGSQPIFEIMTSSRMWQELGIHILDADGDERDDLVLLEPEGFGGNKLIVDLYRGRPNGFESKSFRTVIKGIDESTPHLYGSDWNGDGAPDLLAVVDWRLQLHLGLTTPKKGAVVSHDPSWSHAVEVDNLRVDRLETAGRALIAHAHKNRSNILIVWLPAS